MGWSLFFSFRSKTGILGFRRNSLPYHTYFLVIIPIPIEYLVFLIKKWYFEISEELVLYSVIFF